MESVCNHIWRDLERDPSLVLDLPTWNEYTGTWHAKHREQLPGFFQQVEKVLGGRPLFMTEHGLCEPVFTGGDARRVDEMIYHIGEWKKQPFVCGYIYFCVQDYRTQMGEEGLGKHRIRRHGVTTKDLTPKASYYILQQLMAPIDVTQVKPASAKANTGTLANLYEVDVNNRAAEITIAVKQDIPSYTLRGYMLTFADADGRQQHIDLPDLTPGSEHTMTLPNINSGFHFRILRPDGSTVLTY
jgi:beta-glucuronidase